MKNVLCWIIEVLSDLVNSHLLEGQRQALLDVRPLVRLLPEHLTGHEGGGGDHLVLLVGDQVSKGGLSYNNYVSGVMRNAFKVSGTNGT